MFNYTSVMQHLPLNSLRAFEATARLGSYTKAAAELGVTSAAIGQQVRKLEALVGRDLFIRGRGGVSPSPVAVRSLFKVQQGLALMAQGYSDLTIVNGSRQLSVSVPPTLAIKWLVPRLHRFYARHAAIEVRIEASMRYADLERADIDFAVRFGPGRYPRLRSEHLLDEWVLPLCSPGLRDRMSDPLDRTVISLIGLSGETVDPTWPDWRQWAERTRNDVSQFATGANFSQSGLALQAAVEGQGIALCGITYALDEVLAGRLCIPFGARSAIQTDFGYDLVFRSSGAERVALRAFQRWIRIEAEETRVHINRLLADDVPYSEMLEPNI